MTKTYADQCLERAYKAEHGPWEVEPKFDQIWCPKTGNYIGTEDGKCPTTQFIAHARTDVPELARRLKRACEMLRRCDDRDPYFHFMNKLADELEAPLEENK